mgnify:CR=1 FL=1
MAKGHVFKAYQPGGPSSGLLPASLDDVPMDFDTLQPHGSFIGSAAVVVLSDRDLENQVVLASQDAESAARIEMLIELGYLKEGDRNSYGGVLRDRVLELRGEKLVEPGIGTRFVCPNPLAPRRYLVVQAGTDAEAETN